VQELTLLTLTSLAIPIAKKLEVDISGMPITDFIDTPNTFTNYYKTKFCG
jgi:hypothetical protein